MPLTIIKSKKLSKAEMAEQYQVTEWYYLNADKTEIVPENSPEAAYLLAAPGQLMSPEDAVKYGLMEAEPVEEKDDANDAVIPGKKQKPPKTKDVKPEEADQK